MGSFGSRLRSILVIACAGLILLSAQRAQAAHETGEFVKTASKGTNYTLNVPPSYDRQKGATLLFWLHGAGDNHKNVARAFMSHRHKPDWIFVFPDAAENGRWQGHEMGRVMNVLDEVTGDYSVRRGFIGGFSRGGFFTFNFGLNNVDRFAGFLCVGGGLTAPGLVKKDHADQYAVAILHGDADSVVAHARGVQARDAFERAGWKEKLFFKSIPGLGHRTDPKSMEEALDWLDKIARPLETPDDYYEYGSRLYAEEKYGRALWAFRQIAGEENAGKKWFRNVAPTMKKIERKSQAAGKKVKKLAEADRNARWIEDWKIYDDNFAGTAFHEEVEQAFAHCVARHNEAADRFLAAAQAAAEKDDVKSAIISSLEIRDTCYLADNGSVQEARALLGRFRSNEKISRMHRRLLKGTENWE